MCLRTTRWHAATSEGEPRIARAPPERPSGRIPRVAMALRAPIPVWVAVDTANGQACAEWTTRGDKRRNTAAHGHGISLGALRTALVLGVDEAGSVSWRSRARRLVGSALGGLTGRQLTGPVAEAPEVNLRRSARSDYETELAARSPGGADANSSFFVGGSSRKKSYYEKVVPCPGVWAWGLRRPCALTTMFSLFGCCPKSRTFFR